VVDCAIETGINFFDTADVYGDRGGSETFLGATLGSRRKDVILATKFGLPMDDEGHLAGGSRRYVLSAVEASLKRLKTEWIDIYYLHRPDPATPVEETLRALDEVVRQGKVRFAGCSNLPGPQLADAMEVARTKKLAPLVAKYRRGQPMPAGTRLSDPHFSARFATQAPSSARIEPVGCPDRAIGAWPTALVMLGNIRENGVQASPSTATTALPSQAMTSTGSDGMLSRNRKAFCLIFSAWEDIS